MNREDVIKARIKEVKEKGLSDLYLSHCDLMRIPEEVFQLDHLEHLDLRNNRIMFIPKEIAGLKKLKGLYLNNNKLKELPESGKDHEILFFRNHTHISIYYHRRAQS